MRLLRSGSPLWRIADGKENTVIAEYEEYIYCQFVAIYIHILGVASSDGIILTFAKWIWN